MHTLPSKHPKPQHALAEIVAGRGTIEAVSFRQGRIEISLVAEEEVTLQVAHPYHSHWRATALPRSRRIKTIPSSREGLLTILIPAGTETVKITQLATPTQRWGRVLGTAAVVLLAGAALGLRWGKRRRIEKNWS